MRYEPGGRGERALRSGSALSDVTVPRADAERIAVLLDGRLGEREREILFVALAESADALGVLGDAAAALRDLARAGDIPADLPTPDRVPPDGS